jgi:hypothetical protein
MISFVIVHFEKQTCEPFYYAVTTLLSRVKKWREYTYRTVWAHSFCGNISLHDFSSPNFRRKFYS